MNNYLIKSTLPERQIGILLMVLSMNKNLLNLYVDTMQGKPLTNKIFPELESKKRKIRLLDKDSIAEHKLSRELRKQEQERIQAARLKARENYKAGRQLAHQRYNEKRKVPTEKLKIRRKASLEEIASMYKYYRQNISMQDIAIMFGYSPNSRAVLYTRLNRYMKTFGLPKRKAGIVRTLSIAKMYNQQ
jgi:hypothetical protein